MFENLIPIWLVHHGHEENHANYVRINEAVSSRVGWYALHNVRPPSWGSPLLAGNFKISVLLSSGRIPETASFGNYSQRLGSTEDISSRFGVRSRHANCVDVRLHQVSRCHEGVPASLFSPVSTGSNNFECDVLHRSRDGVRKEL